MRSHVQEVFNGEYAVAYENPNPVILDVGANIGSFALWAALRWPGATIHCYEPIAENFEMLKANTAHLGARVQLNHFAVGDPSHKEMFLGKNNCGECSFFQLGEQTGTTVEVRTEPATVLPKAQVLKLDTEGAELEILKGLPSIDFDVIMFEYHSDEDRRAIDQMLEAYELVGGRVRHLHRGVMKYMKKKRMKSEG
jgi:FkbM family methyltransferase